MNITFGKRNLIPTTSTTSKTLTTLTDSTALIYGGVIEDIQSNTDIPSSTQHQVISHSDRIVGGSMEDNSMEARKKRHAENHLDALAASPLAGMVGLDTLAFLVKILNVLKFIGSIISMLWTLLTIYVILAIIKIIMQTIDTGLNFSHQILRGIRGIFQQINDFNLKIPTISIPDLKIPQFNTPGVDFPEISIPGVDLGPLGHFNFPSIDLPSVPSLNVDLPALNFPKIDIPQMNVLNGLLTKPIDSITAADNKVPNDSIEVLKMTIMALLKEIVPFTRNLYYDIVS
jgi:hypothetical protein